MISKKCANGIVQVGEGIARQNLIYGDHTHLVKFFVKKGTLVSTHCHKEEQTGYLMSGKIIMTIDGLDHELEEGDSWSIKSNVLHSVRIIEDSIILDVFSPIRKEFL
jgi:quercetin dioxygenase-like cupin family protein